VKWVGWADKDNTWEPGTNPVNSSGSLPPSFAPVKYTRHVVRLPAAVLRIRGGSDRDLEGGGGPSGKRPAPLINPPAQVTRKQKAEATASITSTGPPPSTAADSRCRDEEYVEKWLQTASPLDALTLLQQLARPALRHLICAYEFRKNFVAKPWPTTIASMGLAEEVEEARTEGASTHPAGGLATSSMRLGHWLGHSWHQSANADHQRRQQQLQQHSGGRRKIGLWPPAGILPAGHMLAQATPAFNLRNRHLRPPTL
jgi:hypothetical protein